MHQLRAYLKLFGASGASRAFDSFDYLTHAWPGWEGSGKANPGLAYEAKRWNQIRIRRAFELVSFQQLGKINENIVFTWNMIVIIVVENMKNEKCS